MIWKLWGLSIKVSNVDAQVNIESAKITFNETNNFSSKIKLVKLSIEKIVTKIKTYRREKELPKK